MKIEGSGERRIIVISLVIFVLSFCYFALCQRYECVLINDSSKVDKGFVIDKITGKTKVVRVGLKGGWR